MDVRSEVVELATPVADELGFELVDVDYVQAGGRWTVRVFLDRPGGVTLEDCAQFSRRLGDLLEMNQTVAHGYVIEVSSPGIERRLRTGDHFRRFVGRRARVDALQPIQGRRHVEGTIQSASQSEVTLALDGGGSWTAPLAAVRQAHLVVDPWAGHRGPGREGGEAPSRREGRRPARRSRPTGEREAS